jgi:hypothetical protein
MGQRDHLISPTKFVDEKIEVQTEENPLLSKRDRIRNKT